MSSIPTAASLRERPAGVSARDWYSNVAQALSDRLDAAEAISTRAEEEGRDMHASERRECDRHEDEMRRLSLLQDRIQRDHPDANPVDRTGVVPPQGRRDVQDVPLLRSSDQLADWPSARSAGVDEVPRFAALLRSWVTGSRDGLNDAEHRAMAEGTASAGGVLVPTPTAARFIDKARNATRVIQAGATTVPMDSATVKVPRLTGSSAPAWRNENAAIAQGDLTFDSVSLTARSLAFLVTMSRELVEDSDPSALVIAEQDLAAQVALEIDRVALRGSGTAPEPRGVRNTSGVSVTAFSGANGGTPTNYDLLIDAEQTVRSNNYEPTAHIMSSRTQSTLRKAKEATTNAYLVPPVDLLPRLITNQLPGNLTVGTSTDTSEIYTGAWPLLYLGMRTGPLFIQLNERYADNGQIGLIIWYRGDVAVAQPSAFAVTTGVRP